MKRNTRRLQITQMSSKLRSLGKLEDLHKPHKGWINAVRTTLGMSMKQMAMRTGKTYQAIYKLEKSEAKGRITLRSLEEAAKAFEMKLVYTLVPIKGALEDIIEQRAKEMAMEIVKRTNKTMVLEDQQVSEKRLKKEVKELAKELMDQMPRNLWD